MAPDSWGSVVALDSVLITVGVGMMGLTRLTPNDCRVARISLTMAALVLAAKVAYPLTVPGAIGVVCVVALWIATMGWIAGKEGYARGGAGFDQEVQDFRYLAREIWATLVPLFEQGGFFGMSSARAGLQEVVRLAPWPDSEATRADAESLCEDTLGDFCDRVCAQAGQRAFGDTPAYLAFSGARQRIGDVLRKWSAATYPKRLLKKLRAPENLDWPKRGSTAVRYQPFHAPTFKLIWYLEIAAAKDARNENPDMSFIPRLRDALSAGQPSKWRRFPHPHWLGGSRG